MADLTNKERMQIKRQEMPTQDAEVRSGNFDEVALGLTWELAQLEADRCLQCAKPLCVDGCPVGVQIPQFIKALREGDFVGAVEAMKVKNNLPAICGRVCPQESQCEAYCILGKKGQPVAIGRLERFVGDYALRENACPPVAAPPTGRKVAVVGSGPAGLTCAVDLAKLGHKVTIFESLHLPGGVLIYGIPEFRLPKSIINAEIKTAVEYLGIELRTDHVIGNTYTLDELLQEYDAVFLGTGAGPAFLHAHPGHQPERRDVGQRVPDPRQPDEGLQVPGVRHPGQDRPPCRGDRRGQRGHGRRAQRQAPADAVRARRCERFEHGEVHIVYRRSRTEVPAREEEFHHAGRRGRHLRLPHQPGGDPR